MQLYLGNPASNNALDSSYKLCVLSVVQKYYMYFFISYIKHYCRLLFAVQSLHYCSNSLLLLRWPIGRGMWQVKIYAQ